MNTLIEIQKRYITDQENFNFALTRTNKFLSIIPFMAASHNTIDKYNYHTTDPSTTGALNSGIYTTPDSTGTTAKEIKLKIYQKMVEEAEAYIRSLPMPKDGLDKATSYFAKKAALYQGKVGRDVTTDILYSTIAGGGTYDGLIANVGTSIDKGGAAGASTDIFVVRFDEENCHGLYNEEEAEEREGLIYWKWNNSVDNTPTPYVGTDPTDITKKGNLYGGTYNGTLGMKVVSEGYVSLIEGIDATHAVTKDDLQKALRLANYDLDPANTFIVTSALGKELIAKAIGDTMRVVNSGSNDISFAADSFNGVRIITDPSVSDAR